MRTQSCEATSIEHRLQPPLLGYFLGQRNAGYLREQRSQSLFLFVPGLVALSRCSPTEEEVQGVI